MSWLLIVFWAEVKAVLLIEYSPIVMDMGDGAIFRLVMVMGSLVIMVFNGTST